MEISIDKQTGAFLGSFSRNSASLEDLMAELLEMKGYKTSALLTNDGEVLHNTTRPDTIGAFGAWIAVLNSLFEQSCHLSKSSGFPDCRQMSLRTGEEIMTICCSGAHGAEGLRLLVIVEYQGNEPLIRQKLDPLLPQLLHCLTREPDTLALYFKNPSATKRVTAINTMSSKACECKVPNDPLHCNKCDYVFCGSCQVLFRHINDAVVVSPPKKACPNCFSTDLYRKMELPR